MTNLINVEQALTTRIQRRDVQPHQQKQQQMRQKDVTYTAGVQYLHGPSGLLTRPGVDPDVISTVYRPRGISQVIPMVRSRYTNPIFKMLTGQTADSGSEPATVCDRGPTPGDLLEYHHTAPFGILKRSTKTLDMDRLGEVINQGEPMDLTLINSPASQSVWIPEAARNLSLSDEIRLQYWKLGLSIERKMEVDAFTAAGTGQGTSGAGYKAFYGLETLVNTGKIDADTGMPVPAADSLVLSWGNAMFSATQPIYGVNSDLVTLFARTMKYLEARAESVGLTPVRYVIVMRHDLFWELTATWPCSYLTNGCGLSGNNTQFVLGSEQVAMRDAMRNGRYLWINGLQYPVITTDVITETAIGGGVESDIFILPLYAGGRSMLYWNTFDFANPIDASAIADLPPREYRVTDGGTYLWTPEKTSFCFYFELMVKARLVLRAAFLAARITNVGYPTVLHTFSGIPGSLYYQPTGGTTVGTPTSGPFYPTAV